MLNFTFYAPTKVIFGKDTEDSAAGEIKSMGCKKVLIHFGSSSAKKYGLLSRIESSLNEAGIEFVSLGGVVPNPRLSLVRQGIEICRKEGVDFILAVGGGSVIDSAKAIGYGLANDCDVWDIYIKKAVPLACTPIGAILTISAAGSEMSDSSVITNEEGWLKRGCNSDLCRCRFAIMNPELTYTLPAYQIACGGTDIMMHTMERYFTPTKETELTDEMSEGLLRTVLHNLPISLSDTRNYDAQAQLMWAGSISHNGLLSTGKLGDWASHQIEHELGGMFDVAHGAGLAAIWGSWARYVYKSNIDRFVRFAIRVMGCPMDIEKPEDTALAGICAMEDFYRSIGMPISVSEMGIDLTDEQIKELAHKCSFFGTRMVGTFQPLNETDLAAIYTAAK